MRQRVEIIGGGLAGSEAALQLADAGISVDLFEMRPAKMTPAHKTNKMGELVCSNSFGSDTPHAASRILKDELESLSCRLLKMARGASVPAGASLAVDREKFSESITSAIQNHPNIRVHTEEKTSLSTEQLTIVATGPLTSESLAENLGEIVGQNSLYFYDAISPIVSADSLDHDVIFRANRYGKGETADFLNVPLNKEEYNRFIDDLLFGDVVLPKDFEEEKYFEGCMPIEALAQRGRMTLAFGPMKPVGLEDPKTGRRPFAVIQLRTENAHHTAYNLVGFQTKLKYGEQDRIFRTLPGFKNVEFLRLGCMHRNTYLDSPHVLTPTLQLRKAPKIFVAGQLTGTEGYLESIATGLVAAKNMERLVTDRTAMTFPDQTMLGSLLKTISDPMRENFQPINSNMGILPPSPEKIRDKKERNAFYSARSSETMRGWLAQIN